MKLLIKTIYVLSLTAGLFATLVGCASKQHSTSGKPCWAVTSNMEASYKNYCDR